MAFDMEATQPASRSPSWPMALSVVVAGAAVALILGRDELPWSVAGYVLGAIVVPAVTVLHRVLRQSAAKSPYFLPHPQRERLVMVALLVGLAAGMVHAWFVAAEVAKR
jgi:hypothetical protein